MPVSADTLAVLIAKGISGDDLIDVVRAIDADAAAVKPEALIPASVERRREFDRVRQAKRRANERAEKGAKDGVTGTDVHVDCPVDGPLDAPPSLPPQRDINQTPSTHPRPHYRSESVKSAELAFDEEFWPAYPRRVGKDAARKVFVRVITTGRTTVAKVVAGARVLATKSIGKDAEFIPHPATWLNAGRFDDEEPQRNAIGSRPTVSGAKTSNGIWLHHDDPRFQVWAAFKKSIGKTQAVDAANGWVFPSESPPEQRSKNSAHQLELVR